MRVLFDIVHPAHVHFYRFMMEDLTSRGHTWVVASREKDVTNDLLDSFGIPYSSVSSAGTRLVGLGRELIHRDWRLLRLAREFRPDAILTRSPSGTHVGRLLGVPSIFDTDNGKSAGIHYWAAAPFAAVITTPDCFPLSLGPKQMRYPSYKAMAFLHPSRFHADETIKTRLGVGRNEAYFVIRLVSMEASHDRAETGMPLRSVREAIERLKPHGRVFLSSEPTLPADLRSFALPTRPTEFLHVLASASLVIGDSGSVAGESALLGVPSIFVSSFAGRLVFLDELRNQYEMVELVAPDDIEGLMKAIARSLGTPQADIDRRHALILKDKQDLTTWYVDVVESVVKSASSGVAR